MVQSFYLQFFLLNFFIDITKQTGYFILVSLYWYFIGNIILVIWYWYKLVNTNTGIVFYRLTAMAHTIATLNSSLTAKKLFTSIKLCGGVNIKIITASIFGSLGAKVIVSIATYQPVKHSISIFSQLNRKNAKAITKNTYYLCYVNVECSSCEQVIYT